MGFTIWHVTADHAVPKSGSLGPGWSCQTRLQAEQIASELKSNQALTNVQIIAKHYGID